LALPNGELRDISCRTTDEALSFAFAQFAPAAGQRYAIFDSSFGPIDGDLLPNAEDLFVGETLEIAVYRRAPAGSVVGQQQFPPLATVGDVQRRLAGNSPLSTKFGQVLDPNMELSGVAALEFPLFVVSSGSSKPLTLRDQENREETFRFDPDVAISDLKQFISFKYQVMGTQVFTNDGAPRDDDILRNLGSTFLWLEGDGAQVAPEYRFLLPDGVPRVLEFANGTSVLSAKTRIAGDLGVATESILLMLWGKALKNTLLLEALRLRGAWIAVIVTDDT
jgi:hypothetical protein